MLSFPGSLKVYLAVESCDTRKSFNGLYALAEDTLKVDPKSGSLFVFCNKRRNRIKILYFDGTGHHVAVSGSCQSGSSREPFPGRNPPKRGVQN